MLGIQSTKRTLVFEGWRDPISMGSRWAVAGGEYVCAHHLEDAAKDCEEVVWQEKVYLGEPSIPCRTLLADGNYPML